MPQPTTEYTGRYDLAGSSLQSPEAVIALRDELVAFHLDRLRIYAQHDSTWAAVQFIAFETIPLLVEAEAIRMAMDRLHRLLPSIRRIPFWISYVFVDESLPQNRFGPVCSSLSIMEGTLVPVEGMALPAGIGINCTKLVHAAKFAKEFGLALEQLAIEKPSLLVVYPDAGATYDVKTRSWREGGRDAEGWAREVLDIGKEARRSFKTVVVGGCCKVQPHHIKALSLLVASIEDS